MPLALRDVTRSTRGLLDCSRLNCNANTGRAVMRGTDLEPGVCRQSVDLPRSSASTLQGPGPTRNSRKNTKANRTAAQPRSAERRVGKESVSTCKSRLSPYNEKKKEKHTTQTHN